MNPFKFISAAIKSLIAFITPKKRDEYQVEHTLDSIHDIKKEDTTEVADEKTLIEAKAKLRDRKKATKKIKVPKDPV